MMPETNEPPSKSQEPSRTTNVLTNFLIRNYLSGELDEDTYNSTAHDINIIRKFMEREVKLPEIDELKQKILDILNSLPGNEAAVKNFKEICYEGNEKNPPLTYEQFSTWVPEFHNGVKVGECPLFNNFYLRFVPWPKKDHPAVKGMQKEIPALFRGISQRVCEMILRIDMYSKASEEERQEGKLKKPDLFEFLHDIQGELYMAYLIARKYVEDDEVLFR